jgi:hypothetical protein
MLQQLQQAGLLQHLPNLITLATQDLTATVNSAQDPADPGCGGSSSNSNRNSNTNSHNSSSISSSSSSPGRGPFNSAAGETLLVRGDPSAVLTLWDHASHVLTIYSSCMHLMSSTDGSAGGLQPAGAALQLMQTGFEIMPQVQKQLWQQQLACTMDACAACPTC